MTEPKIDRTNEPYQTTEEIFADLAREGRIVDSGQRRWSPRKRCWEIVWVAREFADKPGDKQ